MLTSSLILSLLHLGINATANRASDRWRWQFEPEREPRRIECAIASAPCFPCPFSNSTIHRELLRLLKSLTCFSVACSVSVGQAAAEREEAGARAAKASSAIGGSRHARRIAFHLALISG